MTIQWKKSNDAEYPYEASLDGRHLKIKLNNFPENSMYSLLIDEKFVVDFDDWPVNWKR